MKHKRHYASTIISREDIISYLSSKKNGASLPSIAKKMDRLAVKTRLKAMIRDGQILLKGSKYKVLPSTVIEGYVIVRKDDCALLVTGDTDLLLMPRQAFGLISGDLVQVRTTTKVIKGKTTAILLQLLKRRDVLLVASIKKPRQLLFNTANMAGVKEVVTDTSGYKVGQKVYVSPPAMLEQDLWQIEGTFDHRHDISGLPDRFPQTVIDAANKLQLADFKDRLDLRHLPFVTIDGDDAKDFDDAVYVAKKGSGWLLYVAIADVSAYVKPGSVLDIEAKLRATSVYLPDRVIPMLPEKLSNDLCSLLPNADRAVMVVEMKIDAAGLLLESKIYKAVICSHARFSYTQVADFLDNTVPEFWRDTFDDLYQLYLVLAAKKNQRGALSINRSEQKVIVDQNHKVTAVQAVRATIAHKFIELFMLEANAAVANFMLENNLPALFRSHEAPENITELLELLKFFGLEFNISGDVKPIDIQNILDAIASKDLSEVLVMAVIRSLPQASYTVNAIGHFGLAYDNYCHFTSPIRRYPDLLLHQQISSFLSGNFMETDISALARYCSFAERFADSVARGVTNKYISEHLANNIGLECAGYITSVQEFGFFVVLSDFAIEGMVHISSLGKQAIYNTAKKAIVSSDKTYAWGDFVTVIIESVSVADGRINLTISGV